MNVDPGYWDVCFNFTAIGSEYNLDNNKKSPVLNLLAEDCLDKVEHGVDKGGQVDVVDPLVPHGNAFLAQVDHSPQLQSIVALRPTFETLHLNRVPEGHVSKREVASVNYAREAPEQKDMK